MTSPDDAASAASNAPEEGTPAEAVQPDTAPAEQPDPATVASVPGALSLGMTDTAPDETPEALDDQLGELDEGAGDPNDAIVHPLESDGDNDGDDVQPDGYTGVCRGGPYTGRTVNSRYPKGFLLADKASNTAWLYDRDAATSAYVCRNPGGAPMDFDGRWRAAEESEYDVLAYETDLIARQEVQP